jgi:hypothetical protein
MIVVTWSDLCMQHCLGYVDGSRPTLPFPPKRFLDCISSVAAY